MKSTKPKFLRSLALAAPIAVLAHLSVLAGANEPLAGREIIAGKLDHIRLDKIAFDGMPLGEVVKYLMDEARKRDPEKKGINFVVTSNGSEDDSSREPAEPVDINSITIKIIPTLSDVRLLDALDA